MPKINISYCVKKSKPLGGVSLPLDSFVTWKTSLKSGFSIQFLNILQFERICYAYQWKYGKYWINIIESENRHNFCIWEERGNILFDLITIFNLAYKTLILPWISMNIYDQKYMFMLHCMYFHFNKAIPIQAYFAFICFASSIF